VIAYDYELLAFDKLSVEKLNSLSSDKEVQASSPDDSKARPIEEETVSLTGNEKTMKGSPRDPQLEKTTLRSRCRFQGSTRTMKREAMRREFSGSRA
jgi:hypothetical protein